MIQRPYPYVSEYDKNLKFHFGIGVFVALFLIIFQPFGTNQWQTSYKTLKLCGYGFLAFLIPTFLLIIRNRIMSIDFWELHYKVWHEVLWLVLNLISIALGNSLYLSYLQNLNLSFNFFMGTVGSVTAIGIFPIMTNVAMKYNQYLKLNTKEAQVMEDLSTKIQNEQSIVISESSSVETIVLVAENGKDSLQLNVFDLLYIESIENYCNLAFLADNQFKKVILRGSLKSFENQISEYKYILKCHRSFIVNIDNAEHFSGNAQGYLISLRGTEFKVPISRSFGKEIVAKLKEKLAK